MVEGAAQKAVDNVMSQCQSQQQLVIDSMNGSVEKAVNKAVGGLTSEVHNRMLLWEGQMETQLKSQIQQHWDIFEKKWMEKIVEPDSKETTITLAGHRMRQSAQHEMEKTWKDRMEEEDKITTNKVETLHSQVVRLSEEVVCMKNRHHGSAASTVAASTGSVESTNKFGARIPLLPPVSN